jgi:hypothetical protein
MGGEQLEGLPSSRKDPRMTTFDRLRHLVQNADLIESIIRLDGMFCARLERERSDYFRAAGRMATAEGASARLRQLPWTELREPFAADYLVLTGGLALE